MKHKYSNIIGFTLGLCLLGGCATIVPQFDIPNDPNSGMPTPRSIVDKIRCELNQMLADNNYRNFLLAGDMVAIFQLSLTVNDAGGLTPTISYLEPMLTVAGSATLSQSREQNFTATIYYSLRQLDDDNQKYVANGNRLICNPNVDTNLAGDLGLKQSVAMAIQSPDLQADKPLSGTDGEFGGYVNFQITKNVNALGPTWMLRHFRGPGGLLGFSEINTDRLTFAFAQSVKPAATSKQRYSVATQQIYTINQNIIANQLFINNRLSR